MRRTLPVALAAIVAVILVLLGISGAGPSFLRAPDGPSSGRSTDAAGEAPVTVPPSASVTATCTGLVCTFDGSGSRDDGGTVVSYTWAFGDGTSGTGATVTHPYTDAGTYAATLTVADDSGASATTARPVTVAPAPPAGALASDTFSRTTANGWGRAETGGSWRTTGDDSGYAVRDGAGLVTLAGPGAGPDVSLAAVASSGTDLSLTISSDKVATGSGLYVAVSGRRVADVGEYRATVQLRADGSVGLSLARTDGDVATELASGVVVRGVGYGPGERLQVRTQVTGTTPTTLAAKVWASGTPEPAAWQVSATDATAALQVDGGLGINLYLSGAATDVPVVVTLDDLLATAS